MHADLNECNILVCPPDLVEHKDEGATSSADGENFQAVLIDFVQSVDTNHPQAAELLDRDLEQIRAFFFEKGIKTLGRKMAIEFVTAPDPDAQERMKAAEDPAVDKDVQTMHPVDASEPFRQIDSSAVETLTEDAPITAKSNSATLNPSSVSVAIKGDSATPMGLNQSARTISAHSHSTKSSFSSTASSAHHSAGLKQSSRNVGIQKTSDVSGSHTETSSSKASKKEKKEKKLHKEKKEKKKKKKDSTKESSNGKRRVKELQPEPEQAVMEQSVLPVRAESHTMLFSDSLDEFAAAFDCDKFDWHADWDDDL